MMLGQMIEQIWEETLPDDPAAAWGRRLSLHLGAADLAKELGDQASLAEQAQKADDAAEWLADATPETLSGVLAQASLVASLIAMARQGDNGLEVAERAAFSMMSALEGMTGESRTDYVGEYLAHQRLDPRGARGLLS